MNLKDPRTNWKHILIWVILAFIAGGWILWYTSYFNKEITSLTEPLEIEEPEKVVKDKIANWETYKNEEYKYEIKYPKDWYAYTADPADVYFQPEKEIPGVIPGPHANAFEIEVNLISPDISLVQAIKNKLPEGMKFTQEEVNIGGIDGLRIKTICEGVGCGAPEWFVIKDNYLYHFDSNLGYCETFNEVLSTFKFIRVEDETANWKTYVNTEHHFSIKYPKDWYYEETDIPGHILFANYPSPGRYSKGDSPYDILVFSISPSLKSDKNALEYYQKWKIYWEKNATEKIEYGIKNSDKKVTLFIWDADPGEPGIAWPDARAFGEVDNYIYTFGIATEIPSWPEGGQREEINYLKKALEAFEFIK